MKNLSSSASQGTTGNIFSLIIFILIFPTFLNTLSCSKSPTEPEAHIQLTLEDVSCIEAWLRLQVSSGSNVVIQRDGKTFMNFPLYKPYELFNIDTIVVDDSLLPNKTYKYRAILTNNGKIVSTSSELTVTTMDTTSHNFTFEMITFGGEIGSSVLYDVAIIDESNIWAVGDIWIKSDTSSTGYIKYNAVHWDGTKWELKRIYFPTVCGQTNVTPYPARSIFAFNGNEIWISSSGDKIAIVKDGIQTKMFCLPPSVSMSINKIWGRSSNDLYVVGYAGNIAHYNGTSWSRIESGTTLNINDIWGDYNQKTKEWEILSVGGNILAGYDNIILQIQSNNSIQKINSDSVEWPLRSLWFISSRIYYIGGSGIYQKHLVEENQWKNDMFSITTYSTNRTRGNEINNITAVGGAGELLHFNGSNWKSFIDDVGIPGNYYGTAIFNNTIIAVGQSSNMAVLTIGRR